MVGVSDDEFIDQEEEELLMANDGQPNRGGSPDISPAMVDPNPGSVGVTVTDEEMHDLAAEFLRQLHTTFEEDPGLAAEQLKRYLSWAVPYCFKMRKNLAPLDKEQPQVGGSSARGEALLFSVLEGFLNKDDEMTRYMEGLVAARPSLCGRVFKAGEPTYSCRDCGMDPTCVLCSDCFKNSGHKDHRYRISTSGGGGYCDCGDEEAWKTDKYCALHQPVLDLSPDDRQLKPLGLHNRTRFLFGVLLDYSYKLLTSDLALGVLPGLELGNEETSKLPWQIKNFLKDKLYCTVLYNDETHTFDTVIATLELAVECQERGAMDYATMVDREGRCVVKIDDFERCYQAKLIIEQCTSRNGATPLKVLAIHSHAVAHQIFSLKAMEWIGSLLGKCGAYRDLFASLVEELKDDSINRCMLEGVMLNDTTLWKSARSTWHHVLIAGMLKDYELKKKFAMHFSRNYAELMKEFIADDHDHSYSITSLSVQVFTVPTIAHFLIEDHDVFFTIMRMLMSECEQKLNSERKLEFDRGTSGSMLRRINFGVIDLKYILTIPPTVWTDALVKNFNPGMACFLQLLSMMQGMDAVTRQTGNHQEFELEWESGFNLQIKLQPVLTLSLEWLATNKTIFIPAFRYCLQELAKEYYAQTTKTARKEFADHTATCYVYDVSCEPVSVHLPLSRFFAGLFVCLEQYGLEFASSEFEVPDKPVPEILIEPSLRTQVLLAQVHAGMWKRNGYSILNQLHFYQNVRCRSDMVDKDILALQVGATLIEADEFLIHVLNRFDLFQWVDPSLYDRYMDSTKDDLYEQCSTILSEFLSLVIAIFSARYVPGVGQVTRKDCIRKEIIQLLCIDSMTHSTLCKGLVENVNGETGLDAVIEEIAVFKKASNSNAGPGFLYELKPEFYREYDWHHYHYTREEMSRAEEKQRERKRTSKEAEFFPPPTLPPFSSTFNLVVNILKSDVLLKMISLILQRSEKKTKTFNDSHVRKTLHLIGHGLNEEIARNEKDKEHVFRFCESCERWKIFDLLDGLLKEPHLAQHYDMILWIRKQKSRILLPSGSEPMKQIEGNLLAKRNEDVEKRRRACLAAQTRARLLAKTMAAQQTFMASNADLFATEDEDMPVCDEKDVEPGHFTVALGPNQTPIRQDDETYVCILCKEEHPLSINSKSFILAAFIQRSSVLCETRDELRAKEIDKSLESLERPDIWLRRNLLLTPHISSCGHIMHENCWASHIEGVVNKEHRRPYRRPLSFNVDSDEWLCPMCDCICNAALPMAPPLHNLYPISAITDTPLNLPQTVSPVTTGEEEQSSSSSAAAATISASSLEGGERAKNYFLPGTDNAVNPVHGEVKPDHSLSYRVWLRGMEVMDRITHNNEHDSCDDGEATEVSKNWEIPGEGPFQNSIAIVKLLKRFNRRGRRGPSDGRHLGSFHSHVYSEHQEATKWLYAKFHVKLITFMERIFTVANDKNFYDRRERVSYHLHRTLWHSLTYTIMSAEAYHRDQRIGFFGVNVPIRSSMGLKFLTRVCSVSVDPYFLPSEWELQSELMLLQLVIWHGESELPCIMELDAFGLLVFLTYLTPFANFHTSAGNAGEEDDAPPRIGIQPTVGSAVDHHNLRIVFAIHVYQVVVGLGNLAEYTFPHDDKCQCHIDSPHTSLDTEEVEATKKGAGTEELLRSLLFYLWAKPRESLPMDNPVRAAFCQIKTHLDCDRLWEEVSNRTIPFLRCCAKLYENLSGISPPPALEKVESSFEDLANYLDLPKSFYELFNCAEIAELSTRWSRHPSICIAVDPLASEFSKDPNLKHISKLPLPRTLQPLVKLPMDYTDLINSASLFKCAKCDSPDSRMPTMCLVCGEILCSQSYCCQHELKKESMGGCTYHAYFCGGGIGIFLRIRDCRLFLLSGRNKGCYMLPPYVDQYGETDQGLRRGNPMTLSKEKYDHFRRLWIQHAIPEEIARTTEHNSSFLITEWAFL